MTTAQLFLRLTTTMQKFIAKVAGVAMVVAFAATSVSPAAALTAADIQMLVSLGVISADKATAAMALAGGSTSTGSTSSSCGSFTRDLTLGSTGADVVALQDYLVAKGFLTIPAGVSKGYFGALTQSSLAKYQAAMAISPAAGYFGPMTRAKVSADCGSTGSSTGSTGSSTDLSGGEASLNDYDRKSTYTNEDLEEGETAKVFAAEFSVEDADAEIDRVDVRFEAVSESLEDEPWNQIDSVAIFINGEEVDSMDVDDEDSWSRETSNASNLSNEVSGNRAYEVRFTGLDTVVEEDEDVLVEVEVTTSDNIDDSDLTQSWAVWIPTDGIRAIDGEGIDQYTGDSAEVTEFEIEAADDGDISVRESDDDLDAQILVVDTDDKKGPYEVFRFEIDNSEDASIFLNTLVITASTSDSAIGDVVSDLTVEIDGEEFDYDSASTTANVGDYTFDFEDNNDEVPVEEDERVEIVVKAEFNQASNYAEGTVVQFGVGKINGAALSGLTAVTAEGQATGDASTVTGTQEGAVHTLRTAGIVIEGVSESATVDAAEFSGDTEKGVYELEVQITALEEDAYIAKYVSTSGSATVAGFVFSVTTSGSAFAGTTTAFISEETVDSEVNNRYKIPEGTSDTFTVKVELDPTTGGTAYGISLDTIKFATTSDGTLVSYTVPDEDEYETNKVTVN
ncbi:MAG: trimeric autotransporter adhesin [Candidatus Parcubacteria bacterium]|jgi:hypothetical protein